MQSAVETLSPTRVRLTVTVPFDELKPELDAAYKKVGSQVRIQGFRPGKVPPRVLDQRVGRGVVEHRGVRGHRAGRRPGILRSAAARAELLRVAVGERPTGQFDAVLQVSAGTVQRLVRQ